MPAGSSTCGVSKPNPNQAQLEVIKCLRHHWI
jgi:hypothetical protein